jgi:hydroxymethylbilane synthase
MSGRRTLRIGTRASKLARWQSDWVAAELAKRGVTVEIDEISTSGDVHQQGPLASIGTQGVFTKEIQSALLAGDVDLAVHSLKDLPTQPIAGLGLAATPARELVDDALITPWAESLEELKQGARVGTGSARRRAQLLHLRPDLVMLEIRGNVDTRMRKLVSGEYDAIILAVAGLRRLGLEGAITERLGPPRMLPAPGQGALAIECRADDVETMKMLRQLNHHETRLGVTAERVVLATLHGGCSAPIAAWGRVSGSRLLLDALVADIEGRNVLRAHGKVDLRVSTSDLQAGGIAYDLGREVADGLLQDGAADLLATSMT